MTPKEPRSAVQLAADAMKMHNKGPWAEKDAKIKELQEEINRMRLSKMLASHHETFIATLVLMAAYRPELKTFMLRAMQELPPTLYQLWRQHLETTIWSKAP